MAYHVIYGVVREVEDDITVLGPFYGGTFQTEKEGEDRARELANQKTADIVIPWVQPSELSVPATLIRARDNWFKKFRTRIRETTQIMKRDSNVNSCPFTIINIDQLIDSILISK